MSRNQCPVTLIGFVFKFNVFKGNQMILKLTV